MGCDCLTRRDGRFHALRVAPPARADFGTGVIIISAVVMNAFVTNSFRSGDSISEPRDLAAAATCRNVAVGLAKPAELGAVERGIIQASAAVNHFADAGKSSSVDPGTL